MVACSGRFATKLVLVAVLVCTSLMVVHQLRATIDVAGVPHLPSRFLLQKSREDATTELLLDLDPSVDRSPSMSEDRLVAEIQSQMPSLPIAYWNKYKNKPMGLNATCARFPSLFELEFSNLYWQTLRTSNGTFQLYGAYLDRRPQNRLGPTVRLLGMIDRIEPTLLTHCQLWFEGRKEPVLAKTFEYKYIWYRKWGNYKQGIYQPYLIACVLPAGYRERVPASVSLVERPCDNATNNLRVIYEHPERQKEFAVCVKGLDFLHEDLSVRLVEWIELLHLLGADKVFFYKLQTHANITKVLEHYESEGKVHVTPISLAGGQPNVPSFQHLYLTKKTNNKRQNELIPYNDCFYKHMYEYKYIALLDIDEVIMPKAVATWPALMDAVVRKARRTSKEERASYNVRNVYFLDDQMHELHGWFKEAPRYMHMLQHVYRARNFTKPGQYVKCFHNTQKVLTLHNHFPLACLGSACTSYAIDVQDAQLHHYRADCVNTLKKSCEAYRKTSVLDTTIWRYRDQLVARVASTLRALGYFGEGGGGGSGGSKR